LLLLLLLLLLVVVVVLLLWVVFYRAAVTARATAKAVAAVFLATSMRAVKAGEDPQVCAVEHGAEERSAIVLYVGLVVLLLAVRGAVAIVRDLMRCCQKQPPPSPPLLRPLCQESPPPLSLGNERRHYLINVPMQIKVCKTTGTKYHAVTCCEVKQMRGRLIGTYMPCEKCIEALPVFTYSDGVSSLSASG
jgi:hypothetical protein